MRRSQEELSRTNSHKIEVLDILIVLWLFTDVFLHSFLYIFNIKSTSGQLAIVFIIVGIGTGLLSFKYAKRTIPKTSLYVFVIFFTIAASFMITRIRFGTEESGFVSQFRACYAMIVCTFMVSLLITWKRKTEINLKIILFVDVMFTIVCFLALIRGDSLTTGGYIKDSSGFIYQNISYYSAYALGLTIFHASEKKKEGIKSTRLNVLYITLLLIQVFTSFFSGGRGGTVLVIVLLLYGAILLYGIKKVYKVILPLVIGIVVALLIFPKVISDLGIDTKGLTRVLIIFQPGAIDRGRSIMFSQAMEAFSLNPVLGHGIGSIYYYLHSYSHNFVSDVLAETGCIGMITLAYIFFMFVKKTMHIFHTGSLYRLLTIIFLCGITLACFSGYLWVSLRIWFPIATILMVPIIKGDME